MPMEIGFQQRGDVLIATPAQQRLDSSNAQEFKHAILQRLGDGNRLVLDLGSVEFIDSSGIGAMVGLLKALGEDARLPLVSKAAGIRMLIEMTRLDALMPISASLDEALAA